MNKQIMKHGERLSVPMALMDSNVEATLQARLVDAQVAYRADMNGDTLNDLGLAQRALSDFRTAQTPIVTDPGLSGDYLEGLRDAANHLQSEIWK